MILHCWCHCRGLPTNATHKSKSGLPQNFLLNRKNIFYRFETNTTLIAHVRLKTYMVIKRKTKRNKEINNKQKINKTKKLNKKKTNYPHPTHLGMSSNECRIPNVSISTTMSLKLALWIFSNMSSDVL